MSDNNYRPCTVMRALGILCSMHPEKAPPSHFFDMHLLGLITLHEHRESDNRTLITSKASDFFERLQAWDLSRSEEELRNMVLGIVRFEDNADPHAYPWLVEDPLIRWANGSGTAPKTLRRW